MVVQAEAVYGANSSPNTLSTLQGVGKIFTGNGEWYLCTNHNEHIALELPSDRGGLQNGDTVRYVVSETSVSLTRINPADSRQYPAEASDTLTLSATSPSGDVPASHPTRIYPTSNREAGIYIFSSPEEAARFIGLEKNDRLLAEIDQLIISEGAVAIRIDASADSNESSRATILSVADLPISLETMRATFTSTPLASVPIEVWKQILFDRSGLSFSILSQLDTVLQDAKQPFPVMRAGSVEAQNSALIQWLDTAFSLEKPSGDLAALTPSVSASAMVSDLEQSITSQQGHSPLNGFLQGELAPGITQPFTKQSIITAFESLGFTLEHSLTRADTVNNAFAIPPEETLKSLLLHIRHQLEKPVAQPDSTFKQNPPETFGIAGANSIPSAQPTQNNYPVAGLIMLQQKIEAFVTSGEPQNVDKIQSLIPLLKSELQSLSAYPDSTIETKQTSPSPSTSAPLEIDRLKSITDTLIAMVEKKTPNHAEALLTGNGPNSAEAALPTQTQAANGWIAYTDLFDEALDTVERIIRFLKDGSKIAESSPRDPVSGPVRNRSGKEVEGAVQDQNQLLRTAPSGATDTTLSHALSTAIDRLESLQLLARQVSTNQGTQQIVALPIKFNDTWTEINVRFFHRREQKKKHGSKGSVSVDINVAPPALGSLHAHLDYQTSRQLRLSITFERPSSAAWFIKQREEIIRSLKSSGMVAVHLELRQERAENGPSIHGGSVSKEGIVDVQA